MTRLQRIGYLVAASAALFSGACAQPARKAAPPPARPRSEAGARLSPEDAKKVDQLYYKAVGAYSNNDLPAALRYLDEISAIDRHFAPAAEMRAKIRRISTGN